MIDDEIQSELERFARQMTEHGDAIQILFTKTEDGVSHILKIGAGNWYARKGMCQQFLEDDSQIDAANRIADVINPPEDDSEAWKG